MARVLLLLQKYETTKASSSLPFSHTRHFRTSPWSHIFTSAPPLPKVAYSIFFLKDTAGRSPLFIYAPNRDNHGILEKLHRHHRVAATRYPQRRLPSVSILLDCVEASSSVFNACPSMVNIVSHCLVMPLPPR
ncbi:uncharacterized protein HKW66_Vig0172410 [Vigna angularis]|uniref:Uncharacterized protein n=2 Tax=Phaseolus angularis TaxID=3914 RepID=A0A8T0JQK7_PHAAN|nr:uncharacterized protein HKW66_Vig0172410 [Vigna angularis]BAT97805.1 hypothetical protein VIGAN_09136300 [Vigna angularis var. angularis]